MKKPRCMLTVDVEAWNRRAPDCYVDTLIYGRLNGEEWGIGRMMDIADKHDVKMTFFVDFAEVELYDDAILDAGRYIAARGHDLQIHCHYEFLAERVLERFPHLEKSYVAWHSCEDEKLSDYIVEYCLNHFRKCSKKNTIVFRGGGYRIGEAVLKKLKEKGISADASYNCLRPKQRPASKQFIFENGLLEYPLGILPETERTQETSLNFNASSLYPVCEDDIPRILEEYEKIFRDFYWYYGEDAAASVIMHSWSFCHNKERFQSTGYMDRPNPYAAELFDRFLEKFKEKLAFITAEQATERILPEKTADFDAMLSAYGTMSPENLERVEQLVRRKARDRQVVIWGRGWMESEIIQVRNLTQRLNAAFYISQDAHTVSQWRGRPVKTFEEAELSPDRHYVLVLARSVFRDIRERLSDRGFSEYEDYYDINRPVLRETDAPPQTVDGTPCPICGGTRYETYNGPRPRRCIACGSVERQRTIPKLFAENIGMERLKGEILHVSPGAAERKFFRQAGAERITTVDIRPEVKANLVADICAMPQVASDSFDLVFANCVLNHVYDDEAALSEIVRVLRSGGLFVVWTMPSSNRMKTTVNGDPTAWYGKETMEAYRVGTYRHYGETDFTAQLKRHFHQVRSYEKFDAVTQTSCCWYVCDKR